MKSLKISALLPLFALTAIFFSYTGFWPFWQKKYGNFWTTNHTTPWYNTNNLSVHITQTNANTIHYTYYW